jgi:hypothetical protein
LVGQHSGKPVPDLVRASVSKSGLILIPPKRLEEEIRRSEVVREGSSNPHALAGTGT